jgi:hypothetical protein
MLPLITVWGMSTIAVLAGWGAAGLLQAMFGPADTPAKRVGMLLTGGFTTFTTVLFLMAHVK